MAASSRISVGRDFAAKDGGSICQVANTCGMLQMAVGQGRGSGATFQNSTFPGPCFARQYSQAFAS